MRLAPIFRIALVAAALGFAIATTADAGRLFGDIKIDGKPLAEGVKIKVKPPGDAPAVETTTDKFGSYKILVKEEGKCVLTVTYEKSALELPVFSNKEATRYDLVIETKDGKRALRRK
jgi:hypothetical protein